MRNHKVSNKIYYSAFLPELDVREKFKNNTLLEFLESFDPYELKYSVFPNSIFYQKDNAEQLNHTSFKKTLPGSIIGDIAAYESCFRFGSLNKETYSSIKENLMLVYGNPELVQNDIQVFHLTERKLIHQFLAIPQLDKMFDEDYFNFEWDMHVGQNFVEHRNDYMRDHFIHQIRDMYSMLVLLGNYGFYDEIAAVINDRECSKISQYTCKKRDEFIYGKQGAFSLISEIQPHIYRELRQNKQIPDHILKRCSSVKSYAESYFIKYIIYASAILSALFHDMGYPICHFLSLRNRTSAYNPTLYMFTHNDIESFDHISSILSSSLLFTIISPEEIKQSLQCDKGKYNHGAYSAIAFLMQFYHSGHIFSLPVEKQCAIELAAVSIYNHTIHYKANDKKTTDKFYLPVFRQNPVSFLLRLCDDLQEWGRRYFEISGDSEVPICCKCFTPSISSRNRSENKTEYACACQKQNAFRFKYFDSRKIFLITTSYYMTSDILTDICTDSKVLRFRVDYDYFRLLQMSRINPIYAKYRLKELNDLKRLLENQKMTYHSVRENGKEHGLEFDNIYIDYFMTANPITIKLKILEKYAALYLKKDPWAISPEDIKTLKPKLSDIASSLKIYQNKKLYKILSNGTFDFYCDLLQIVLSLRNDFQLNKPKGKGTIKAKDVYEDGRIKSFINNVFIVKTKEKAKNLKVTVSSHYFQIMSSLIFDCAFQYAKEIVVDGSKVDQYYSQNKYFNQYAPSKGANDLIYDYISAYCNSNNDFNSYNCFDRNTMENIYIGYFADLYFFELMNKEVRKEFFDPKHFP